eukprot:6209976-Pleurochrysis_carterae.AAC.6
MVVIVWADREAKSNMCVGDLKKGSARKAEGREERGEKKERASYPPPCGGRARGGQSVDSAYVGPGETARVVNNVWTGTRGNELWHT